MSGVDEELYCFFLSSDRFQINDRFQNKFFSEKLSNFGQVCSSLRNDLDHQLAKRMRIFYLKYFLFLGFKLDLQ